MAKTRDPFKALRPKTAEVAVGEHSLKLKTATLDQESRFLEVIQDLDLDKLIKPITGLINGAQGDDDGKSVIQHLADNGAAIWGAARTVLGKQFAPSVRKASIALPASQANMKALIAAGIIELGSEKIEESEDGAFLGCAQTRLFITENLTLMQGLQVVKTAWTINNYSELLGNLMAPLTAVPTK